MSYIQQYKTLLLPLFYGVIRQMSTAASVIMKTFLLLLPDP
jgi:hypothetical protein